MLRPLLAGLLVLLASTPAGAAPLDRRARGDLAIEARGILRKYCAECHGPDHKTHPAQSELAVLDHPQLVGTPANRPALHFVTKGDDKRSYLIELIECGAMPPGGQNRPTAQEIAKLKEWVTAEAPSYPQAFDERTTLAVMLNDLDRIESGEVPGLGRDDIRFVRYLSFAHLVQDDQPLPNLKTAEFRLQKALTASAELRKAPQPVDDTATLFRLDLRSTGWDARDLFRPVVDGTPTNGVVPIIPYDLILFEYPHGYTLPPDDDLEPRLGKYLDTAKQARRVPFIRGDWLSGALQKEIPQAKGEPVFEDLPLAEELKELTKLAEVLPRFQNKEKGVKLPVGPKARPFLGARPALIPGLPERRQPIYPINAFYSADVSPDPAPFTFTAELRDERGVINAIPVNMPFQIKVQSDRQVFFVVLHVQFDGEVQVKPVVGGNVLPADKPRFLRPDKADLGGGFRITSIDGGDSTMEYFIVIASQVDIPTKALTIIKSKHADRYVWRFVLDPTYPPLDPTRIVRKVLPLKITRN